MKGRPAFHPPLLAIYTPLALYAANVSLIPARDVLLPTLICLLGGMALWGIFAAILRDAQRAALAASAALFAIFVYGPIDEALRAQETGAVVGVGRSLNLGVWSIGAVLILVLALRRWNKIQGITAFLNFAGSLLVLLALGSIGSSWWAIRGELSNRKVGEAGATAKVIDKLPDIYYLVFDGYGRTDTFERLYGFSDQAFTGWLQAKGFVVAKRAHSNYVQTELSLASTLNLKPIDALMQTLGQPNKDRMVLDSLIDQSEAARRLRRLGYRYFAITSGFPALTFDSADMVIHSDSGSSLFTQSVLFKTPLRPSRRGVDSMYEARRGFLDGAFKSLHRLAPPSSSPRFIVAHILAPHPPFVFGPDGEPRRPKRGPFGYWDGSHFRETVGSAQEYRDGYRDQAIYIAKRTQSAIEAILKATQGNVIILVQGDHGPKAGLDQNEIDRSDLPEAFSILLAAHMPKGMKNPLAEDSTPINLFGKVLGELSGVPPTLHPEKSYFSSWEQPLNFIDVTDRLAK